MSAIPVSIVFSNWNAGASSDAFAKGSTTMAPTFAPRNLALLTYHAIGAKAGIAILLGAPGEMRTVSPSAFLMVSVS